MGEDSADYLERLRRSKRKDSLDLIKELTDLTSERTPEPKEYIRVARRGRPTSGRVDPGNVAETSRPHRLRGHHRK